MINESAQIIKKSTVLLCLTHFNSDIQKIILYNVIYISFSSANLISDCCIQFDNVIFNMTDCTLHYNNNIIEHVSEVNRLFQLHLNNSSQFYTFAVSRDFKISFKT